MLAAARRFRAALGEQERVKADEIIMKAQQAVVRQWDALTHTADSSRIGAPVADATCIAPVDEATTESGRPEDIPDDEVARLSS